MTYFYHHYDSVVGLFLVIAGILVFIFPPKFGNPFFGMLTKKTLKNETVWVAGQKLFATSIMIIGLIFFILGNLDVRENLPSFSMVLLLIALWSLSKYIVHKILERKFPHGT